MHAVWKSQRLAVEEQIGGLMGIKQAARSGESTLPQSRVG